jgi:hypothetical protein
MLACFRWIAYDSVGHVAGEGEHEIGQKALEKWPHEQCVVKLVHLFSKEEKENDDPADTHSLWDGTRTIW